MALIPCCSLRNNVLILDDDLDMLKIVEATLRQYGYKSVCASAPEQARRILNNNNLTNNLLSNETSRVFDEDDIAALSIKMHISPLKDLVYNPDRFEPVTVLVVDFDMPNENGLEFVQRLNNPDIKIIMLTGKAESGVVIKAFNDQVIHRYISKGDPNYIDTLVKYIQALQNDFYVDLSQIIMEAIRKETKVFSNPEFIEIFNKLIQENNIVEYYILDESGSFLMLDATAENQIWLIIKSENDMKLYYELASDDRGMTGDMLDKLKNKEIIPFFMTEREEIFGDPKDWKLFKAKPLDQENNFYYAILINDEALKIDKSRIKPYSVFINE